MGEGGGLWGVLFLLILQVDGHNSLKVEIFVGWIFSHILHKNGEAQK